ncbi:Bromodomain-containing protein [Guyanagaster necrorhizus]|uniref:Bromodomain-containing protein n=1 Tax=Guyanagaster necrorhizus TaxID=856835 RepID=A0A9P7W520_9AGAR|nr:Bromodomain-containing protein [Guyanagaster necrorhizus MCA 3950]KAG7452277.1 Bromodomain-containing protein [Guyanagaster necrorhizus MCA 3950]
MGKRNHPGSTVDEGSRAKRRKDQPSSSDVDVTMSDPVNPISEGEVASEDEVREQGMKIWQTVKDAVNKDGRSLSTLFLTKPLKRQYPDYFDLIKQPIALDDIKKKLNSHAYPNLEAVKLDFDLCFTNAKSYNHPDSIIWQDAKDLQKLAGKTYKELARVEVGEDGKKKSKPPSLNRMAKSRLEKLISKTDDTGRTISAEFMELPSKKDWPIYYKEIKHPQCLENIFKRIKRKEYAAADDFANDVELVFSNALAFNQEHTLIWEDALTLRNEFRRLMSDLPFPFTLERYSKPTTNTIKIKVPAAASNSSGSKVTTSQLSLRAPVPEPTLPHTSTIAVRAPPAKNTPQPSPPQPPPKPVAPAVTARAAAPTPAPPPLAPVVTPTSSGHVPSSSLTPQPQPTPTVPPANTNITFLQYSKPINPTKLNTAISQAPALSPTPQVAVVSQTAQVHSMSNSPAPVNYAHQLRLILIKTIPRGRQFNLDYREGVRSWSVRLGPEDKSLRVEEVIFMGDEEESSGGEEEVDDDNAMDVDAPMKNGKKKIKRGRGRPPKVPKGGGVKVKPVRLTKKKPKLGEIQVKINGSVVQELEEHSNKWLVDVPLGSSTLELGEKGGLIWKVYTQRVA